MLRNTTQELKPSVSQRKIIDYIAGDLPEKLQNEIRKKNEYKLLFEIIKLSGTSGEAGDSEIVLPGSYSEIESLVEKILSGEATHEESRKFITALRKSFSFYQKVMVQLKSMTPEIMDEDVPELNQVRMQTVEQTVDFIKKTLGGVEKQREPVESVVATWTDRFISGIAKIFEPVPKVAYAYTFVLLVVTITSYNFYSDWSQQRIFLAKFSYDTNVPLDYTKSSFRGGEGGDDFKRRFSAAMAEYVSNQYRNAIAGFGRLQQQAESLAADSKKTETLHDYYLFYGLSHLAYARSQKDGLAMATLAERDNHSRSAVELLLKAKYFDIDDERANQNIDYFLGVAYWFTDEKDKALVHLKNVSESNKFYDKSQLLISKLESGE